MNKPKIRFSFFYLGLLILFTGILTNLEFISIIGATSVLIGAYMTISKIEEEKIARGIN